MRRNIFEQVHDDFHKTAQRWQWEIVDRCLQMHGGYGYINEYEIARLWRETHACSDSTAALPRS